MWKSREVLSIDSLIFFIQIILPRVSICKCVGIGAHEGLPRYKIDGKSFYHLWFPFFASEDKTFDSHTHQLQDIEPDLGMDGEFFLALPEDKFDEKMEFSNQIWNYIEMSGS